jgi:hypothetical protein
VDNVVLPVLGLFLTNSGVLKRQAIWDQFGVVVLKRQAIEGQLGVAVLKRQALRDQLGVAVLNVRFSSANLE